MPENPQVITAEEYEKEKKKRLDSLYEVTGKGMKIIGISIVAYMAITAILTYFLHPSSIAITWGAVMIIAIEFPTWLFLVLRASRRLRRLKWEFKV
ncbi:MAG: hypothetical protein PHH26_09260 [Candidatus Thermoplasmatota archaeon]|nr:hypothetical protein [Candidatus Thermoplasmatota archaeon]